MPLPPAPNIVPAVEDAAEDAAESLLLNQLRPTSESFSWRVQTLSTGLHAGGRIPAIVQEAELVA